MSDTKNSSGAIVPFSYADAQVRVVVIDGEPWFVLVDLCKVLAISDVSIVRRRLDEGVCSTHPLQTAGGKQNVTVVSEAGMYEVIFLSRKPEARAFKRWVTGTVLPEIRRTGSYGTQPELTGPELLARAVLEAQTMLEAKDQQIALLAADNQALTQKVESDAPKVNYVQTYVADDDCLKLRTIAAHHNVGEDWLRELLLDKGWIYVEAESRYSARKRRVEKRYRYSAYSHKRPYFKPIENHDAPRFKGEVMHTLKITPVGAEAIARLIVREVAS